MNHIGAKPEDVTLHHSCGVEMVEYKEASNIIDCFINDVPYIGGAEKYTDDTRDLCNQTDENFYKKIDIMLGNMKRLIKKSNYEEGIFKPIIMKVGSNRNQGAGLHDSARAPTDVGIGAEKHPKYMQCEAARSPSDRGAPSTG